MNKNGADISLGCQMDSVPTFPHGFSGIFVSEGAKIGKNCVIFHQVTIGSNTLPDSRGKGAPVLGNNVYIGAGAKIIGNVTVGDNVLIGPHCSIAAGNHKFDPATGWFSARTEKDGDDSIVIGTGSWLASNVTVTGGVKIGRCCLICAGAVVTKSTEEYSIMAGIPAKKIGHINPETGEYIWETEK